MKMQGARIVVETLIEQGVDTMFGYPGGFVLNIFDELYKASDRIKLITTCHEQGAAHAADGYSRASGKTGVVISTSGPGATNLVTGIASAYLDSTPLIAITGNVPLNLIGRDSFQEVDITGITMPITKHNFMVKDVKNLADTIREAFKIANSGRPGPVLIDIPKDVQTTECEFENKPKVVPVRDYVYDEPAFLDAVNLIKQSKRPFIYMGGGVLISGASKELLDFANKIDAPIGSSMMGLSAIDNRGERFLGMTGMHGKYVAIRLMDACDLIIAIGTRFSDRATGNKQAYSDGRKIIHIDIDPAEIDKNIFADVSIIGDVKKVLTKLNGSLETQKRAEWSKRVKDEKSNPDFHLEMNKTRLNPQSVIETLRKYADDNTIIATDVGQHQMWTAQYYKFTKPRTLITSGGLGAMGFGLGAAIGAASATKNKTILFTSDGSFHMNMNEMATAVSENLPVVIIILNNNALGMVRQWQTLFFEGRYSHTSLQRKTDYVKLANAFGLDGVKITKMEELDNAVKTAFLSKGPYLIEAVIDSDEKVLPMIPAGGSVKDIIIKG